LQGTTLKDISEVLIPLPQDLKTLLDSSPYSDILQQPENFGLSKNEAPPRNPRKYMLETLKRRSILNCELFKETNEKDSKPKTLYMTENIQAILGI
jgi:hypothetical protein